MNGARASRAISAVLMLGLAASAREAVGAAVTVSTVSAYAPGVAGGPATLDAASNTAPNGITLAVLQPLVAAAFAANTGGTINFENATGWVNNTMYGDGAANPISATYGTAQSQTLKLWRTDVNATLVPIGVNSNNNNGVNVVSGTNYMGVVDTGSPVNLAFNKGLSALGFVLVPRGAARTVTMTALLDDTSTIVGSAESVTATNTPGAYFWGFRAPVGRTIVGLNILSPNGFSRFDDIGFVAVPEPSSIALVAMGCLGTLIRRRRR